MGTNICALSLRLARVHGCFSELRESALPCPGRRCVCAIFLACQMAARCHFPALHERGNTRSCSAPHVFWRALGQSANSNSNSN